MDKNTMSNENNAVAFSYLIWIGLVNMIVAAIKALERVSVRFGETVSEILEGLLEFSEPYGKVALSVLLLIFFYVSAKKKCPGKSVTLLNIWGIVFVGVQIYYYLEMIFYDRILKDYFELASGEAYTAFYASTHGFKYAPMFIGIMFGIAMTGIMLKDRYIKVTVLILSVLYLFFFGFQDMAFLSFRNTTVGIVLCSALFHSVQTAGMLLLGIYLKLKYREQAEQI